MSVLRHVCGHAGCRADHHIEARRPPCIVHQSSSLLSNRDKIGGSVRMIAFEYIFNSMANPGFSRRRWGAYPKRVIRPNYPENRIKIKKVIRRVGASAPALLNPSM